MRTLFIIISFAFVCSLNAQTLITKTSGVTDSTISRTIVAIPVNPGYSGPAPVSSEKTVLFEEFTGTEKSMSPGIITMTVSAVPANTVALKLDDPNRRSLEPIETREGTVTELKLIAVPISAPPK